jgi:tetratricopeptide (TPR) repeat protein
MWVAVAIAIGAIAAAAPHLTFRGSPASAETLRLGPAIGMPGAPPTSANGLRQRIGEMEARLKDRPADAGAAMLLADALLRQARATSDGRPANRAAVILAAVLKDDPGQYDALRLLGAIDLSRHRFRDALDVARRARDLRPGDAWNYGVLGDALVELGEYDEAFDAFDRMAAIRPGADAYARISYARELRGDVVGALDVMELAASATSAHDAEAKAWYIAHTGELYLKLGRLVEAERAFRHAAFFYPDYPHAAVGLGKVHAARGEDDAALAIYRDQFARTPTLDLAARIGDLFAARGAMEESERYYQLAEDVAGPPITQTEANLAVFLADHNRRLRDALGIAQTVAAARHDILTDDALAWTLFKVGRIDEAAAASARALRTGTRDERILTHAAAIRARVEHREVMTPSSETSDPRRAFAEIGPP